MVDTQMLAAIIPLVVLELGLKVYCLVDWRSRDSLSFLPRPAWLIVVLFVNLFGPIAYLLLARRNSDRS